jgi:ABC-2 type transport system ATP-binding protein
MKQRIKIASAIVHDPKLLILDEPTNGMDPAGRDDVLELARDLSRNKGMSLIFSSHLLPDVEAVCDHIVVVGGGQVLAQGKLAELKQPHTQQLELRVKGDQDQFAERLGARLIRAKAVDDHLVVDLPDGATPALVWETALAEGEQIRSLRPRRSTLEEVFLQAVGEAR